MTMRLYHPELKRTHDFPDSEPLFSVLKESGWSKTIPASHTDPALADEQPDVVYQPVPSQAKVTGKSARSAKEAATD
jgi:hypothetical protein